MTNQSSKAPRAKEATRNGLLELLANPTGLTRAQLCRRTSLSWSTIHYHLEQLQAEALVESHQVGKRQYYVRRGGATCIGALKDATSFAALTTIQQQPGTVIPAIANHLGSTPKVVRGRLADLARAGLVKKNGQYRIQYRLTKAGAELLARQTLAQK